MLVDDSLIKKIAELACIELQDEEVLELRKNFSKVLSFIEELQSISSEVENVPLHVGFPTLPLREDRERNFPSSLILDLAPEREKGCFKVPEVVKKKSGESEDL